MMRLEDSREDGLLNSSSTQYSSFETSMRMSEFDLPMGSGGRSKRRGRCYVASVCIVLVAVAAIVSSVTVGKSKSSDDAGDDTKGSNMRNGPHYRDLAPAPSPSDGLPTTTTPAPPGFVASSPPAPSVPISEPVSSPALPSPSLPSPSLPSPTLPPLSSSPPSSSPPLPPFLPPPSSSPPSQSPQPSQSAPPSLTTPPLAAFAPSPYSSSYDLLHYDTICNTTIDPAVCVDIFASNPDAPKVDFQQWTIMTMEAVEQALNESYTLALSLKETNNDNLALGQCIDLFSDALVLVNESMFVLAGMDVHNPGPPAGDVHAALDAAMTDHDTCQDGIDDVGPFPGSQQITGQRARHVDTLFSISLTFFNELIATSAVDPNHHRRRRLLHVAGLGRRGLVSARDSQRSSSPGKILL